MDDLISRAAALDAIDNERKLLIEQERFGAEHVVVHHARRLIEDLPAVDAVPIKPLSVWLAGYAVPPKYTVETNPVDSAKARAEGWEKHIRNLIECGLMEEE